MPVRQINRRIVMLALSAACIAPAASAQTATEQALQDFGRYLDAAASLFGQFALGIREARASGRLNAAVREDLRDVNAMFRMLYARQSVLVGDLEDYARAAREGENVAPLWAGIKVQVRDTAGFVSRVTEIVENSDAIVLALDAETTDVLQETLYARRSLLARFYSLPPPRSPAELTQLEGLNARYRTLIQTLREVRIEIEEILESGE
jgi:uncharacterized membrane protein YccC